MPSVSTDRDRARLEQELETAEYKELLTYLQREEPSLRQFRTWGDVLAFMHTGTSRDPRKDEVLRPILAALGEDQDHRWQMILFTIFWLGLMSISRKKRRWDKNEPDELWQRIFWAFHESVCRIDLTCRRDRLVQWIYNTTVDRLREQYRRDWRRSNREVCSESGQIEQVADLKGIDLEGIDRRIEQEIEIGRLRDHLVAGRISEADFLLLVGTRLYGQSIPEYARGAGLKIEATKKRRQRAEVRIRCHETEMQ